MTPDDDLVETTTEVLEGHLPILVVYREADENGSGGSLWQFMPGEGVADEDVVFTSFGFIFNLDPSVLPLDQALSDGGKATRAAVEDPWVLS